MNRRFAHRQARRPSGIVLPTVMILLLILTVASLVLVEQITSQTRMASNAAVAQQSLQVAEATLRNATASLLNGNYSEADFRANANGLYFYRAADYSASKPPPWKTAAGWAGAQVQAQINSSDTTTERKFMIEEMPPVSSPGGSTQKAYRITARVVGPGSQGSVMLQTLYKL